MYRLAVPMSRQAMKGGQHSDLGWLSGKMILGVIDDGSDSRICMVVRCIGVQLEVLMHELELCN